MKIHALKLGVVFGLALGLWHAMWAALVACGLAQPIIDWIFQLHFLSQPFDVQPFDWIAAATLVAVTAGVGFFAGVVIGLIWNAAYGGSSVKYSG